MLLIGRSAPSSGAPPWRVELMEDPDRTGRWIMTAVRFGEHELTIFDGALADARARQYGDWRYRVVWDGA